MVDRDQAHRVERAEVSTRVELDLGNSAVPADAALKEEATNDVRRPSFW